MSWAIDIDPPPPYSQQQQQQQTSPEEASSSDNESNAQDFTVPMAVPSAKKIRIATLEGIRIGILPEYQDYGIVLPYLVKKFLKHKFKFNKVLEEVPWLGAWLVNPFNSNLLNEELQLAAQLEASKIRRHVQYMLRGGFCTRTCGRFFACVCCCVPLVAILCKVCAYFADLTISLLWGLLCDWWLGAFCRKYIVTYICYVPKYLKLKLEDLTVGEGVFDDEELSIRNIYDSNSYRIANQYACMLFLAIALTMLGVCLVTVSYLYLPKHPDQLFVRAESVLGVVLLTSGCFGLQFYCRCTL